MTPLSLSLSLEIFIVIVRHQMKWKNDMITFDLKILERSAVSQSENHVKSEYEPSERKNKQTNK